MGNHVIARTDAMIGTKEGSYLENVKVVNGTKTAIDADNGLIVQLGDLVVEPGAREVYLATAATTTEAIGKVLAIETAGLVKYYCVQFYDDIELAVVATPEVMVEEHLDNLSDFYNEAGSIARAYRIHKFDQFSVSEAGISGTLEVGDEVKAAAGKFAKK